ncbi:MAG: hypothetical protein ACRYE9_00530 [Janthinobacterium lividum]
MNESIMRSFSIGFWSVFNFGAIKLKKNRNIKLINYFSSTEENIAKALNKLKDGYERDQKFLQ